MTAGDTLSALCVCVTVVFSLLNTEGRVHQWACIAEKIVLSHPGRCDCGQLLWSFHCRKPSVWRTHRWRVSAGGGRGKIRRGTDKQDPIIESFFSLKLLGYVFVRYLITVVWFRIQVLFMKIIIIKCESGQRSGQDQNIYFNNKVRTFLEREDILLGPHSFQG